MKTKNIHIEKESEVRRSNSPASLHSLYRYIQFNIRLSRSCLTIFSADSFIAHFLLYHVLRALFRFIVLNFLLCESHCSILCILVSTEHFSTVVSKSEKNYSHIAQQSVCVCVWCIHDFLLGHTMYYVHPSFGRVFSFCDGTYIVLHGVRAEFHVRLILFSSFLSLSFSLFVSLCTTIGFVGHSIQKSLLIVYLIPTSYMQFSISSLNFIL